MSGIGTGRVNLIGLNTVLLNQAFKIIQHTQLLQKLQCLGTVFHCKKSYLFMLKQDGLRGQGGMIHVSDPIVSCLCQNKYIKMMSLPLELTLKLYQYQIIIFNIYI